MNLAILVGTIVSDITRTDFPKGGSVTRFRLKTVEPYTLNGELKEGSQTHLIDIYNDHLQNGIVKTLRKGQTVSVQGSIQSRNIAREGEPARWTTTIVLRYSGTITFQGGGKSNMAVVESAREPTEAQEPRVDHSPRKPVPAVPAAGDLDDDIPF